MDTKKIPQMSATETENLRESVLLEFSDIAELKGKLGQLRLQIKLMTNEAFLLEDKLIFLEDNVSAVIKKYDFKEKDIEAEIKIRKKREELEKRLKLFVKEIKELYPE